MRPSEPVQDPALSKEALRRKLLALRRALTEEAALALSTRVQDRVLALPVWKAAKTVALYVAARREVSTERLLDAAWSGGKTVLLPRCLPEELGEGLMELAVCPGREKLVPGAFGLFEPDASCPAVSLLPDLILVPAVGVGPTGARLGHGKGFYDRLLARPEWSGVPRAALVYAFQIADVPSGPSDEPMHLCVTEKEVLAF